MRKTVIEIIEKECELYRLKDFGLVTSVEEEADRLLSFWSDIADDPFTDTDSFALWKKKVTSLFYSLLDYAAFLERCKSEDSFSRFLLALRKRLVNQLHKNWREETIDSSLAIPPHTLAFKLSVMLSEEADKLLFPFLGSFHSPYELEDSCYDFCKSYFPVDLDKLLLILRKNDKGFWDDIYLLIKCLAVRVTSYLLLSNQYKEEIEQDTWSESALFFQGRILTGVNPSFDSAAHLRNYIVRICRNKCYEVMRCNRQQEVTVNNKEADTCLLMAEMLDDTESVWQKVDVCRLSDIDIDCDYEVSVALTIILWDKPDPWYTRLVKGVEEKVEILRLHYVDGLSYEKIACLRSPGISIKEQQRMQNRLRQDVVRVRRILKERFVKILADL